MRQRWIVRRELREKLEGLRSQLGRGATAQPAGKIGDANGDIIAIVGLSRVGGEDVVA